MKKLLIISLILLFSCNSSEENSRLISEKLSSIQSDNELFWVKLTNTSPEQPTECVYKWFQNGYVYSERCTRLWEQQNSSDGCIQDWYYAFPLNEISILNETSNKIVFSYNNEIHEVILSNDGKTVQLKYNDNPNYRFITNKITDSKLLEWQDWKNKSRCN